MTNFSDIPRGGPPGRGMTPLRAGAIAVLVIAVGTFFAFSKANPLASPYELVAVFEQTGSVQKRSPVRIAGVNVGKVVGIEKLGDGSGMAKVRMEISDEGLPIHRDAELKVRSRLFLEGNYFVELRPGTPGEPELPSGAVVGPDQTAAPVQLNQVLTTLQSETREDVRTILKELSTALADEGAAGFNEALRHQEAAYRDTSQVNDATLGLADHDLTRVLAGQAKVFGALARDERALRELVTGLNQTLGGFAAQEDNLAAAIPRLRGVLTAGRPALASLNRALPSVRAFARDALPAARSSRPALDAQIPFMRQARRLVAPSELGGTAKRLRATLPELAGLNRLAPRTLEQARALAACQTRVLRPFAEEPIPDPDFDWHTGEPFFKESARALVGLSGESRLADANSPFFRVGAGGGPSTVQITGTTLDGPLFAQLLAPIQGVRPARPVQRPAFRPDVPCETQEPPNLNAVSGAGDKAVTPNATRGLTRTATQQLERSLGQIKGLSKRLASGKPTRDPISGGRLR